MPRYSDDELDDLKRNVDLVALIRSRGIELRPQGQGNLVGLCPFHAEKTPSFGVSPAKKLWHCLGCGAAGNAIQFVQKFDKLSFRHAVELLKSQSPALYQPGGADAKKLPAPVAFDADDRTLVQQVTEYYHKVLKESPPALDYLKKRGLNAEAIAHFQIGYADRTLGLRLPAMETKAGAGIRQRLQKLGLYRKSGHEHFNGCVVFPLRDERGQVIGFYGRKIYNNLRPGTAYHLYLPGPHRGLFNPACLMSKEVILCEAVIDAVTFWCAGFEHVTCAYGTEGFTEEMENALVKAKTERVCFAFDRDKAGDQGAGKAAERLQKHGIECRRVLFPHGMDANQYALKVTPPNKSLGVLLTAAQWLNGPGKAELSPVINPSPARAPAPSSLAALEAAKVESPEGAAKVENDTPPLMSPVVNGAAPGLALREGHGFLDVDGREYRVAGLDQLAGAGALKVALRLRWGERFHLDQLDLARDADRRRFVERAAEETGLTPEILKRDMGKLLLAVELYQREMEKPAEKIPAAVVLTPEERAEALAWSQGPDLLARTEATLGRATGLTGETKPLLVLFLAGVSRLLERPLAVMVLAGSAAGKSTMMDAALAGFPEETKIKYSALTGQALYYLGETSLKHKILAVVEEAGAEKAAYALKLLQSEGELTIASTGKDPATGRLVTQEYHVEGPVSILITTTAIDLDEELLNRCLVLTVDESSEQTQKIHTQQRARRTLAGLAAKTERAALLRVLRNAQRLLRPLAVVNPFAPELTFPHGRTRARRDHEKYLTLIDAIALLHQHQRKIHTLPDGTEYIEVTRADIAAADALASVALGRSLDELPPQTRRLLEHVRALVKAKREKKTILTFSRRELREHCGWSFTQTRLHLERLVEWEYVSIRAGRLGVPFVYELADGDSANTAYDGGWRV